MGVGHDAGIEVTVDGRITSRLVIELALEAITPRRYSISSSLLRLVADEEAKKRRLDVAATDGCGTGHSSAIEGQTARAHNQ